MKAAVYYGAGDVRIEQVARPQVGPEEVLLRVLYGALCGTDASAFKSESMIPLTKPHPESGQCGPTILGHEMVGFIVGRGEGVTTLRLGDRVVPGAGMWCGTCRQCQKGRTNICERYYLYGIDVNGGFAELVTVPAKMCVSVPDRCSDEVAAMAQPCAVALHALSRAQIKPGQTVGIFGVGNIGTLILACLQAQMGGECRVIVVDIDETRLATARSLDASVCIDARTTDPVATIRELTGGDGVDIAIEASGVLLSIGRALDSVRRGGRLLQVGIPLGAASLSLADAIEQEKEILTTNGQVNAIDLPAALQLLTETDLATRIGYKVISLDDLVEQGIRPLVTHAATKKILVKIS